VEKFAGTRSGRLRRAAVTGGRRRAAVRTGLAILDEMTRLPGGALDVRIGIETGGALVELTARPELGEPFVTGWW